MKPNQDAPDKPAFTRLKDLPPVTRAGESDRERLSIAQKQVWFMSQSSEAANVSYNLPFGFHFQGQLNVAALRNALNSLIIRHEVFRTTFHSRNGQPFCSIKSAENMTFQLREVDISDNYEIKSDLHNIITSEATTAFDLEYGPLIRGYLIRESSDSYTFLFNAHHIIFDGWSAVLLFDEICNLYNSFDSGGNNTSNHLETQYSDYCHWQHKWVTEEFLKPQAEYWKKNLGGASSYLPIPTDRPRPDEPNHSGAFVGYGFDAHLTRQLKALSSRHGVSLFVTVFSAWMVLLSKLSGEQDIIVGSAIANRERKEVKKLVGLLAGVLPLRTHISAKQTVVELLLQVKAVLRNALDYQDVPFEEIVKLANPLRNPKYHPLFQTCFSWPISPKETHQLNGLKITPTDLVLEKYDVSPAPCHTTELVTNKFDYILALFGGTNKETITKFDLAPIFWEFEGQIMGAVEYSTALFERDTIERYLGYWRQLLEAMVTDDQQCIDQLPMLGAAERHQVLEAWNDTACEYPAHLCVHELFEAQVAKTPMARPSFKVRPNSLTSSSIAKPISSPIIYVH